MENQKFWIGHVTYVALAMVGILLFGLMGDRSITVLSEQATIKNRRCIVIDPGHGGEDGGAISCTGILESTFNLEIALRLDSLFHLLGYETKMIRKSDTAVHTEGNSIAARKASDLKARVRMANETENGLLISIHQNYFDQSQYSGAQVFYAKTEGSQALAQTLQNALRSALNPGSTRKEKPTSGVYLMEHITCPGILIECGFLSNPDEEAHLRDSAYQKKLCCTIAATICNEFPS